MPGTASKNVLIVDDSRVSLKILKTFLSGTEFEVVGDARSGAEALAKHRELSPDLVILDIVLPGMDGVQVLEGIRCVDPSAGVVMASSLETKGKMSECLEKGAAGFLMKPYGREELLVVLRAAVRRAPLFPH